MRANNYDSIIHKGEKLETVNHIDTPWNTTEH